MMFIFENRTKDYPRLTSETKSRSSPTKMNAHWGRHVMKMRGAANTNERTKSEVALSHLIPEKILTIDTTATLIKLVQKVKNSEEKHFLVFGFVNFQTPRVSEQHFSSSNFLI